MTSVGSSILTALNAGSGIDTSALVSSLVSATREPKQTAITSRQTLNTSRISALASAASSLDTFADALTEVLSGAAYTGTAASNDASIALHRDVGFEPIGVFRATGRKFDAWHDVSWWQRRLRDDVLDGAPPTGSIGHP